MVGCTVVSMSKLSGVPEWVCPRVRAVSGTESFLLWLFDRTRSPEVLGSWSSLSWLAGAEGEQTVSPLGRRGPPTEVVAWAEMTVANAVADGGRYPSSSWWAARGIDTRDRMPPEQWAARVGSGYEREYAHGVAVALGWLVGEVDDPTLMAPNRDGDGDLVVAADREEYRSVLRELSVTSAG